MYQDMWVCQVWSLEGERGLKYLTKAGISFEKNMGAECSRKTGMQRLKKMIIKNKQPISINNFINLQPTYSFEKMVYNLNIE
jgi:hypothetical protein